MLIHEAVERLQASSSYALVPVARISYTTLLMLVSCISI